jgi:hypothetical protein
MSSADNLRGTSVDPDRSWLRGNWPYLVASAPMWLLPTARARQLYTWTLGLTIFGMFFMKFPDDDIPVAVRNPWPMPSVWTYLIWMVAVYFFIKMFQELGRHKRALRQAPILEAQQAQQAQRYLELRQQEAELLDEIEICKMEIAQAIAREAAAAARITLVDEHHHPGRSVDR